MKRFKSITILSLITLFGLSACGTDEFGNRRPMTDAEKGTIFGATAGALLGGAVSNKKNRTRGVLLGAVGGGIAGGLVGNYMDKQKKDLERVLAPERNSGAIQVDKLQNNVLRVTMTEYSAFSVDSAEIKGGFYSTMDKIASIINRYGKTKLIIVGHTDNTGSHQHNQQLSERRAHAVNNYFLQRNVYPQRLDAYGRGFSEPRASNHTARGRAQNRRVEVYIEPVVADR